MKTVEWTTIKGSLVKLNIFVKDGEMKTDATINDQLSSITIYPANSGSSLGDIVIVGTKNKVELTQVNLTAIKTAKSEVKNEWLKTPEAAALIAKRAEMKALEDSRKNINKAMNF